MLTLFEQHLLHYSPLESGMAWLPLGLAIGSGIGLGTALTRRFGVRVVAAVGFIGAGVGLVLISTIGIDTSYFSGILPGMIVFGVFAGATMPAATTAALHGVTVQDSGLAPGVQSTMQQVGSALGLAVLVTLALRYTGEEVQRGVPRGSRGDGWLPHSLPHRGCADGGLWSAHHMLFERANPDLRDPTAEIVEQTR